MATSSNSRDVKMTLSVETLGAEEIKQLQGTVANLAKQGGDAAPEFQKLADEIGRLGEQAKALQAFQQLSDQTGTLAERQAQAAATAGELRARLDTLGAATQDAAARQRETAAALLAAREAARTTRDELAILSATTDRAGKTEDAYAASVTKLKLAKVEQRAEVERLESALKASNAEVTIATQAEGKLAESYKRAAASANAANGALQANSNLVQEASAVALTLGVNTENVAAAQAALVQALNQSGRAANVLEQDVADLAATERSLAAIKPFALLAEEARLLTNASENVSVFDQHLAKLKVTQQALTDQSNSDKWQRESFALVEAAHAAQKLARETELLTAVERELAAQAAFEKQAQDARKLVQAGDYVRFWRDELDKAEVQAKQTAEAAKLAGRQISDAFRTLGIRSAQELETEISQVRSAMETVRSSAGSTGATLSGAFAAGEARVKALEREIRQVSGTLTTADKAAKLFSNSLGQIAAGNIIADGVGYLVNKVKELGVAFLGAVVQGDQLRRGLTAVYKDAAVAASQIDFLRKSSSESGVAFGQLTGEFIKFSASMRGANIPMEESNALFNAVTNASASLGLGAEATAGSLNALGQMASKGVVSLEELRGQLGDRLPAVMSLTAKGLNITEAQLIKLVESGKLATRDFVVPFTRALKDLGGETNGLMPTFSRFTNALTQTAQAMGDSAFVKVFTGALKGLAIGFGVVLVPLAGFVEYLSLVGKGMALFASGNDKSKDALADFSKEVEDSGKRMADLKAAFKSAAGVQDESASATDRGSVAMTANTSAMVKSIATNANLQGLQKLTALSTALAGDATLDASAKIVQYNVAASELLAQQQAQSEAYAKLAKAAKQEGDTLVELARLTGNETALRDASVAAADQHAAALAKVSSSQSAETAMLLAQKVELEAYRVSQKLSTEQVKVQADALDILIVKSRAESEQSKVAADAATQDAFARKLAAETYRDNAAKVGEYAIKLAEANAEQVRAEFLQSQGLATQEQVNAAKQEATRQQVLFNDALGDSIGKIDREARAKEASLRITIASTSVQQAHYEVQAKQARASGDYALALQYEISAKDAQIKGIQLSMQLKKLEADADLKAIEIEKQKIPVNDTMRKIKLEELEIRTQLVKLKQIEANAGLDAIKTIELEITALRNGNGARDSSKGSIDRETGSRDANTRSINLQTAALEKQKLTSDGFKANADGSASGTFNNDVPIDKAFAIRQKVESGKLTAGDLADAQSAFKQAKDAKQFIDSFQNGSAGAVSTGAQQDADAMLTAARIALETVQRLVAAQTAPAATAVTAEPKPTGTKTVNIVIGGRSNPVNVTSDADANMLTSVLRQLESAAGTAA